MANASVLNFHYCHECGDWTKNENEAILRHIELCHKSEGKGMFICPVCIKPYSRKWTLSRHVKTIHHRTDICLPSPSLVRKNNNPPPSHPIWPSDFNPSSINIRVLYGNNSPYPSCFQVSASHPPRTLTL